MDGSVWVGVFRATLSVPGARSRKERRQVVRSLRDRVRHRFDLTFREIVEVQRPLGVVIAFSAVGSDARVLRSSVDKIKSHLDSDPRCVLGSIGVEVFRWDPPLDSWMGGLEMMPSSGDHDG